MSVVKYLLWESGRVVKAAEYAELSGQLRGRQSVFPINSHNPGRFRRITLQVSFTRATERIIARYGQYAQAGKAFPYRGAVIGKIIPEATQQVVFFDTSGEPCRVLLRILFQLCPVKYAVSMAARKWLFDPVVIRGNNSLYPDFLPVSDECLVPALPGMPVVRARFVPLPD